MDWYLVIERLSLTLLGGAIVMVALFSAHIVLFVTRREFGRVHIDIAYFTRNDYGRNMKRQRHDTLNMRTQKYEAELKKIHHNRWLFWKIIWMSLWVELDRPAFDFGPNENRIKAMLSPFAGRIREVYAKEEGKRASGKQGFVETKYKLCLAKDFADDTRIRILRIVAIREQELENFQ